ncbi:hypothetical protein EVAR_4078_1 [Eumeta japonica]|uniref:Uncharacterized protein n=1 Tax=Eumeta variegata TaxID=151549 RepID=A0A4C1T6P3_EUMVA|nr:hypothetical protein EVAR_4078_1 [Eumeta japonica]
MDRTVNHRARRWSRRPRAAGPRRRALRPYAPRCLISRHTTENRTLKERLAGRAPRGSAAAVVVQNHNGEARGHETRHTHKSTAQCAYGAVCSVGGNYNEQRGNKRKKRSSPRAGTAAGSSTRSDSGARAAHADRRLTCSQCGNDFPPVDVYKVRR